MVYLLYCNVLQFCIGPEGYYVANPLSWCADNLEMNIRDGCASDEACLAIGRKICDADATPNLTPCFGVTWNEDRPEQNLKICLSNRMETKTDGWRTMMKQGIQFNPR